MRFMPFDIKGIIFRLNRARIGRHQFTDDRLQENDARVAAAAADNASLMSFRRAFLKQRIYP